MTIKNKYGKICINKISGYWCLDYLYIEPECRGQGHADELMRKALDKCNCRPLYLFACCEFGANYKRLIKFYKRYGFKEERQLRSSDVPFNYNMILWS